MDPALAPVLRTLERVDYIISCIAEKCGGEAKIELTGLANDLEDNPRFAIAGAGQVAATVRAALSSMLGHSDYGAAACMLGKLSGELWQVVLADL